MTDNLDLNSPTDIMRQIVHEDEYAAAMRVITDAMAADAKQHAPVEHGDYRDGIHGQVWSDSEGWHGALVGDNFKTVFIEHGVTGAGRAGDVSFPAQHTFLNAAQGIGLNTTEETV